MNNTLSPPNKIVAPKSSIGKASGVVGGMTLASRVLGLARDTAIATAFGAGAATDAFFVAFKIGNLLRRLVAEGSLSIAFVPIFAEELAVSQERARSALRTVATCVLIVSIVLCTAGIFWAEQVTALFAPGFVHNPEKLALAASLMRVLFPYVVLVSVLALTNSALNALGYFALPAFAPAVLNISILLGILFFRSYFDPPIYVLAWAVLVGGLAALLPQVVLLRKIGYSLLPTSNWAGGPLRRLGVMMIPSAFSASVYQLMVFVNTLLASLLPEGSVSWLYYADRLFQFPLGVFSLAIATAILPALAHSNAQNDKSLFRKQLQDTIGWVSYITIPATCGLYLLAHPLMATLYERGSFTPEYTLQSAAALRAYAVGLWAISCQTVLVRAYLAKRNTKLPAIVSAIAVALNLLLALALMGPAQAAPASILGRFLSSAQQTLHVASLAHAGLALAGSLASIFSFFMLWVFLSRIESQLTLASIMPSILKTMFATLIMGILLLALRGSAESSHVILLLGVPLGALCFLTASLALGSKEAKLISALLGKLFSSLTRYYS